MIILCAAGMVVGILCAAGMVVGSVVDRGGLGGGGGVIGIGGGGMTEGGVCVELISVATSAARSATPSDDEAIIRWRCCLAAVRSAFSLSLSVRVCVLV